MSFRAARATEVDFVSKYDKEMTKKTARSQVQWHPPLRRKRQENQEFKVSLGCAVNSRIA